MKKYICFDCENRLIQQRMPAFHIKSSDDVKKFWRSMLSKEFRGKKTCEYWTNEFWEKLGYEKDWGDAAVRLPDFNILRKSEFSTDWAKKGENGKVSFVILCPKLLRRPVILENGWGSY